MSTEHPHSLVQLALSSTLTIAIFSLPLWSLSHEPQGHLITHAIHPSTEERVAIWLPSPEPAVVQAPASLLESEESGPQAIESIPLPEPAKQANPVAASPARTTLDRPEQPSERSSLAKVAVEQPPSTASLHQKRSRRTRRDCRPDVAEIDATGAGRWRVKRKLIDHYASNLGEAEKLARVTWARDADDQVIGFQVIRVRCGSPLWNAGFRDGDIITAINGQRVRTVPQALTAYVALRIKRTLRVRGQRKDGSPIDHRYRLT
jgi:hypothetical protein